MSTTFEADYAEIYDLFYEDKDYEAECDFLEEAITRFSSGRPATILDMGCGTGGHVVSLARRGYQVAGLDMSASMVRLGREKADREGLDVSFHVSPMQDFDLGRKFDVVISMFNAINYVTTDQDLEKTLANVRGHLSPGGLFLFDFRNGITSLRSYSPVRNKWVERGRHRILRISETQLDAVEQISYTNYTCLVLEGDRVVKQFEDRHVVRYFFPREVRYWLEKGGFGLVRMCRFLELDALEIEDEWNIVAVARPV